MTRLMGKLAGLVVLVILAVHVTGMDDDGHNFDDLIDSPDERLDFFCNLPPGLPIQDKTLLVCLFVFEKRPNGWNDRAQTFFSIFKIHVFLFLLYNVYTEKIEDGREAPCMHSKTKYLNSEFGCLPAHGA